MTKLNNIKTIQVLKKEDEKLFLEECDKIIKSTIPAIKFYEENSKFFGIIKEKYIAILEDEHFFVNHKGHYFAMEEGINNEFVFNDEKITLNNYGIVLQVLRYGVITKKGQKHLLNIISEVDTCE